MEIWANKFGTTTFEGFMKHLFEDFPLGGLQFFNRKAVYAMGDGKVAEMVLSTRGTSGHYKKIIVSIIHKDNGTIASESFNFEDYLTNGWIKSDTDTAPLVIDCCEKDWYMNGPTPQAIKNLMQRIADYISFYK